MRAGEGGERDGVGVGVVGGVEGVVRADARGGRARAARGPEVRGAPRDVGDDGGRRGGCG